MSTKEYDLIVFGATSFTGKHTDPIKVEPPNAQSINSYNKKYFDKLVEERTEIISNISSIQ